MRRRCTFRGDDAPRRRATPVATAVVAALLLASCDYFTLPLPDDSGAASVSVAGDFPVVTDDRGRSATLSVALGSRPLADVQLTLSTSDATVATVEPALLSFTNSSWSVPQQVTVRGMLDQVRTGDRGYTIVFDPAVSLDARYSGYVAPAIAAVSLDSDVPGVVVTATASIVTSESGSSARLSVRLRSAPLADVLVPIESSDPLEGTVAPASLRFTPTDWFAAQVVTVTGVDDLVVDGDRAYEIRFGPLASDDAGYAGVSGDPLPATNLDDDFLQPGITVFPTSGLVTTEAGGTAAFTVMLQMQPEADVSLALYSSNPGEGSVSPTQLVFTPQDWNVPVTVTVTGADDPFPDGPQAYTIVTVPAVSPDLRYQGMDAPNVSVTNLDND